MEYRTPLALVNQGLSVWPLHLDRVLGSLFVDAGDAWGGRGPDGTEPSGARPRPLVSVGAELTAGLLTLYRVDMRLRLGVARPLNGGGGNTAYVRLGLPF